MPSRASSRADTARARALPDAPRRVAIEAGDQARDRLVAALGDRVAIVPPAAADVVLLDAGEEGTAGDALAGGFHAPTVVLLAEPRLEAALALLRAGAAAVLSRHSDERELLAAIDAVSAGLLAVDAGVRDGLGRLVRAMPAAGPALTDREREVLGMLAEGLSNKRIAQRLRISEHTVKAHVGSILGKLGAATRAEAVRLGVRLGYVML